jgi:hypothetical protein
MAERRPKLVVQSARVMTCALLTLVSFCWGADKPPKKFHTGPSHPLHALAKTGEAGYARSSGPVPLPSKTQTANQMELSRLEQQNAALLKSQSAQKNNKASGTAAHLHPEATHSSSINFSNHPPRGQSTGTSGGHKY